ncbi:MAG: hypothetical protein V3V06_03300 [Dehalococcoidia bacterium]
MVAIVNLTTRRERFDNSCVIQSGEHPFIQHDSVVNYRAAELLSIVHLDIASQEGFVELRSPVSPELLLRIQEGAIASIYTSGKVQDAIRRELE